MTSHARSSHRPFRNKTLGLAIALAIGVSAGSAAQAGRLGHAHVMSEPGAPLQMTVPLLELSPEELSNLQVRPASESEWQNIGLQPPVPLDSMATRVEAGPDAASRVVRVTSTQPPASDAIDMLLHMRSSAGERLVQVTVLVPARNAAAGVQGATAGAPAPASAPAPISTSTPTPASSGGERVTVRPGQTLWGIAASHAVAGASIYQMLDAILLANPQAFIGNNMNLVRAGSTLVIPDDATVRAISSAEAHRVFDEQAAAFSPRRPGAAAAAPSPRAGGASGKVEAGAAKQGAAPAAPDQDQLRLSSAPATAAGQAEAAGDARASEQRELDEARKRVDELKSNVDALNRATNGEGAATGSGGASAQAGAAGSGAAGSGAAGSGATQAGAAQPGVAGSGTSGFSAPAASAAPGEAATPAAAQPATEAPARKAGLAAWIGDHLAAAVIGVLVLVVLAAVWLLRRASKRQEEEDDYGYDPDVGVGNDGLDRKLKGIDLSLDSPEHGNPDNRDNRT